MFLKNLFFCVAHQKQTFRMVLLVLPGKSNSRFLTPLRFVGMTGVGLSDLLTHLQIFGG